MTRLAMLLIVLFGAVLSTQAQESSAPYFYYQSGSAIRIERADGTDRHIIPNTHIVGELAWSEWSPWDRPATTGRARA